MPMRIAASLRDWARLFPHSERTVVSIGNFDGIHLGHQKILSRLVNRAFASDALSAVVTFDPHPLRVLRPAAAPPLINTLEQRLARIEEHGIDATLLLTFDEALSRLSPEDFVRQVLVEHLRVVRVLVGANFRFGHQQAGDVAALVELGRAYSFQVEVVPPVLFRRQIVSSTAIRDAVREGRVTTAARLLGRPFLLTGEVITGTGTGGRLVVPTLNLAPHQELLPAPGVYITESWLPVAEGDATAQSLPNRAESATGRIYPSVTNVGYRPTFDGTRLTVESYLLDFSGEFSPVRMAVGFWHRLREEKKFSDPAELRAQIARDIESARAFFRRLDRARQRRRARPVARAARRSF